MSKEIFDVFNQQIDCTYKDERYSVRDNGSILRHSRPGRRKRIMDGHWTFGKKNENSGMLEFASVPVHKVVATAFHDEPPSNWHVAFHIDTNKQNNRPENLRWITRLENALLNPYIANHILIECGSVEVFLENPAKFRDSFREPNNEWICAVNINDAQASYQTLVAWAKSENLKEGGTLAEWIFSRNNLQIPRIESMPELTLAITPNAAQRDWRTMSEFPCCPLDYGADPLTAYFEKMVSGTVFCTNSLYTSKIFKHALSEDRKAIYVISESNNSPKPWAIAKITFEDKLFVHSNLGTFLKQEGAEKYYSLAQGFEWVGDDTFDDLIM